MRRSAIPSTPIIARVLAIPQKRFDRAIVSFLTGAEVDALLVRWADAGRPLGFMVGFTIKLLDAYGAPLLRDVVADMLERGVHDRGAMAILCEQRRKRQHGPAPNLIQLGAHVVERDVIPHDLGGYDE